MALVDELRRRKTEIESELSLLDREAADARDTWERKMTEIREKRQQLEEVLIMVKALIEREVK